MTDAIQISRKKGGGAGTKHFVRVGDLKVMIVCDRANEWYAQGLEIDYLAQGTSFEDVKASFEVGLTATIETHLKINGDIRKLLKPAPAEVWDEYYRTSTVLGFSQISEHDLTEDGNEVILVATTGRAKQKRKVAPKKKRPAAITQLPFKRITYVQQCAA